MRIKLISIHELILCSLVLLLHQQNFDMSAMRLPSDGIHVQARSADHEVNYKVKHHERTAPLQLHLRAGCFENRSMKAVSRGLTSVNVRALLRRPALPRDWQPEHQCSESASFELAS